MGYLVFGIVVFAGAHLFSMLLPDQRNALGKEIRDGLFAAWDRFERDSALDELEMRDSVRGPTQRCVLQLGGAQLRPAERIDLERAQEDCNGFSDRNAIHVAHLDIDCAGPGHHEL